jgi:serine/threonine protein kinase
MNNIDINNLNKYKVLGNGYFNTTYEVKQHVFQIGHVLAKDARNKKSNVWKSLNFYKIVRGHRNFTNIIDFKIINNCKYKHKLTKHQLDNAKYNTKFYKHLLKVHKSPYCLLKYRELIKGDTLSTCIGKLSLKQKYSIINQLIDAIIFMKKKGYRHSSIHGANVMYDKTKDRCVIIDYDDVVKGKEMKPYDKTHDKKLNNNIDLLAVIYLLWKQNLFKELVERKINLPSPKDFDNHMIKSKQFMKDKDIQSIDYIHIQRELFNVKYPKETQHIITNKLKKIIPNTYFIPKEDIIFMYKNVRDINKIKKYINNKMKISR